MLQPYLWPHAWVPAAVVVCPDLQTAHAGDGEQHVLVEVLGVQRVEELLCVTVDVRPQRLCRLLHLLQGTNTALYNQGLCDILALQCVSKLI